MAKPFWLRTLVGLTCGLAACAAAAPELDTNEVCVLADGPNALAGLGESSGVALARRTPGVLWSHNDSGAAELFAIDAAAGQVRGRVRIPNATVTDWEDIAAGPCAAGTCLYIADIGDNNQSRRSITIYRIPEPQPQDAEAGAPEVFTAVYPDGRHDAEALFAVGDDLFILTKAGTAGLYRFPRPLQPGTPLTLERVGEVPLRRVTGADVSPDGTWAAVRTNDDLVFYRAAALAGGETSGGIQVSLRPLKEPQGEGVALDANGTVYLTSEGSARAGSLITLRCTLPQ